ncbi:MAG: MBL fold metallo-hydrolase [Pseudomonadota bacterium]
MARGPVAVRILGSGDAFGSGGRLNTCILVEGREDRILIDCGGSAMISLRRFGVDPNGIGAIVLSHLHADHFGGLPTFILDAQLVSKRAAPLVIAGPEGLAARLEALMEAHFPGSSKVERRFETRLVELRPGAAAELGVAGAAARVWPAVHPSGTPSQSVRLSFEGREIAYTGDTEWTDALLEHGRDADLLIAEAYTFERKTRFHLDWRTLAANLPKIRARRVALTHMSPDMLARAGEVEGATPAEDGSAFVLD